MIAEPKKLEHGAKASPRLSEKGQKREEDRKARLGAALRANLRRRKGQAQARAERDDQARAERDKMSRAEVEGAMRPVDSGGDS